MKKENLKCIHLPLQMLIFPNLLRKKKSKSSNSAKLQKQLNNTMKITVIKQKKNSIEVSISKEEIVVFY